MNKLKLKISKIIKKIILEDREALKDTLDHDNIEDVIHATYNSWEGGELGSQEAENLVLPIDHGKAGGAEPVTKGLEVLSHPDGKVVSIKDRKITMEEALRIIIRSRLQ